MAHHERRNSTSLVLRRYINGDLACVVYLMCIDDERFWVVGVDRTEYLSGYSWVEAFAFTGVHGELLHTPLWNSGLLRSFWCGDVLRPNEEITIGVYWWIRAVRSINSFKLNYPYLSND